MNQSEEELNKQLNYLRETVDNIDKDIVSILEKRIEIAIQIGKIKKDLNLSSFSPEREDEIFHNIANFISDQSKLEFVHRIYERILDECRIVQKKDWTQK